MTTSPRPPTCRCDATRGYDTREASASFTVKLLPPQDSFLFFIHILSSNQPIPIDLYLSDGRHLRCDMYDVHGIGVLLGRRRGSPVINGGQRGAWRAVPEPGLVRGRPLDSIM